MCVDSILFFRLADKDHSIAGSIDLQVFDDLLL
jgi:hypothetical protein